MGTKPCVSPLPCTEPGVADDVGIDAAVGQREGCLLGSTRKSGRDLGAIGLPGLLAREVQEAISDDDRPRRSGEHLAEGLDRGLVLGGRLANA